MELIMEIVVMEIMKIIPMETKSHKDKNNLFNKQFHFL